MNTTWIALYTQRCKLTGMLILFLTNSAYAQQMLKVDLSDKDLMSALQSKTDLLSKDNGFEASGSSAVAQARLPVVGVLPSDLSNIFSRPQKGFESAPAVPEDYRKSDVVVTPATAPSKLQYSITYEHIADGLDALCSGTRTVRSLPKGLKVGDLKEPATPNADSDDTEVHSASAQQIRFGLPYKCDVYCSDDSSLPYCRTGEFAEKMLRKAIILSPGIVD